MLKWGYREGSPILIILILCPLSANSLFVYC